MDVEEVPQFPAFEGARRAHLLESFPDCFL